MLLPKSADEKVPVAPDTTMETSSPLTMPENAAEPVLIVAVVVEL